MRTLSLCRKPGAYEAYMVSWVSLIATVLAVVVGFIGAALSSSPAILGFALENAVDAFSSALVLWRFWGGGDGVSEAMLELREKRASVGIAILFVILGIVVASASVAHLAAQHPASEIGLLIAISAPSVAIFLTLGVVKLRIGGALDSPAMKKDAACSLCGALLSFGSFLGATYGAADPHSFGARSLDASVALIVSLALGANGVYTLGKNARQRHKWWTSNFWALRGFVDFPRKQRREVWAEPTVGDFNVEGGIGAAIGGVASGARNLASGSAGRALIRPSWQQARRPPALPTGGSASRLPAPRARLSRHSGRRRESCSRRHDPLRVTPGAARAVGRGRGCKRRNAADAARRQAPGAEQLEQGRRWIVNPRPERRRAAAGGERRARRGSDEQSEGARA